MNSAKSLEPAIDPNNRITFLLDWEITMKCNLDCSYCYEDIEGGHDNSTKHPPLDECLKTIDFMFEYADIYMSTKPRGIQYVILNVYGGESLHHPHIVKILQAVREGYKKYKDRWNLTVTTTTNGIVSDAKFAKIIPLIDEFTMSYHAGATGRQHEQFRKNLLAIKSAGVRQKCIVLMHPEPENFKKAQAMIEWLNEHSIKHLPRQIDTRLFDPTSKYRDPSHIVWFEKFYNKKTFGETKVSLENIKVTNDGDFDITSTGRACCGGRQVHCNQDYKTRNFFVPNIFPNWHCSVNHFFVFIKQLTKDVYTNKDCKMNFDSQIGPIGNLDSADKLLEQTRSWFANNNMPVIQCKKRRCLCGLCAPKAESREDYDTIIKKYLTRK